MSPGTNDVSLLLVRHGQSVWNAQGRWQGQADPPLSELGEQQAAEAGSRLQTGPFVAQPFDAVVASDLIRARRTAEILASTLGVGPVTTEPGLREFDVGEWCGLTRPEIESKWPGMIAAWSAGDLASPPGGEDRYAFTERAEATVTTLARARAAGSHILVVTHGGLIRRLAGALGAKPSPVLNLGGWWFDIDPDGGRLRCRRSINLLDPGHRTASPTA